MLWTAIRAIQERYPHVHCLIYTGDQDAVPSVILDRAYQRFGIRLPRAVDFCYLKRRDWIEDKKYVLVGVVVLVKMVVGGVLLVRLISHLVVPWYPLTISD